MGCNLSVSEKAKAGMTGLLAIGFNNIIADSEGNLPWKCQEDMKWFRHKTTTNHYKTDLKNIVIMGRKTFESVGFLPGRINVVMTRPENKEKTIKDISVQYDNLLDSGEIRVETDVDDIGAEATLNRFTRNYIVIGGPETLMSFAPYISHIWISHIAKRLLIEHPSDSYLRVSEEFIDRLKVEYNFGEPNMSYLHQKDDTVIELDDVVLSCGHRKVYSEYNGNRMLTSLPEASSIRSKMPDYVGDDIEKDILCKKIANNYITLYTGDVEEYESNHLLGYHSIRKILGQFQPLGKLFTMVTAVCSSEMMLSGFDVLIVRKRDTRRLSWLFDSARELPNEPQQVDLNGDASVTKKDITFKHDLEKIMRARNFEI